MRELQAAHRFEADKMNARRLDARQRLLLGRRQRDLASADCRAVGKLALDEIMALLPQIAVLVEAVAVHGGIVRRRRRLVAVSAELTRVLGVVGVALDRLVGLGVDLRRSWPHALANERKRADRDLNALAEPKRHLGVRADRRLEKLGAADMRSVYAFKAPLTLAQRR